MTYLEAVNNVLKLLREDTVTSVTANTYSTLIGMFVNIAKQNIENKWDWTALRTYLNVTTSSGTGTYTLTGSNTYTRIIGGFNVTQLYDLKQMNSFELDRLETIDSTINDPIYFSENGISAGELTIKLYSIPRATETIRFWCVVPQADLSSDSTTISIPGWPVVMSAYAMAIEERGETGSIGASSAVVKAEEMINNAIILDAQRQPTELEATVV